MKIRNFMKFCFPLENVNSEKDKSWKNINIVKRNVSTKLVLNCEKLKCLKFCIIKPFVV